MRIKVARIYSRDKDIPVEVKRPYWRKYIEY